MIKVIGTDYLRLTQMVPPLHVSLLEKKDDSLLLLVSRVSASPHLVDHY